MTNNYTQKVKNSINLILNSKVKKEKEKEDLQSKNGKMTLINLNIVIVENLHMVKWLCVKIPTAKSNGSIDPVLKRKNYLINGFVKIVDKKDERLFIFFEFDITLFFN